MLLIALAIELRGAGIDWISKLPLIALLGWAFARRGRS